MRRCGPRCGTLGRAATLADQDRIRESARRRDTTLSGLGALAARATALHGHLAGRGLAPGDRVAILSENRAEYVEALMACARGGFILCCQNWRLAEAELAHCLGLVAPRATLASPRYAELAARLASAPLTFGASYEAALSAAPEAPAPPDLDPEAGLVILYTSGTTGLPKGALISHRAEIARAMCGATDLHVEPDEGFVAWAPMFHMVSTDSVFGTLMQGGRIFVTDGFDPDRLAAIVTREKLGRLTLMPGMITPFLDALDRNGGDPVGVRYAGVMADLVPHDQLVAVTSRLNAPYLNTFGSTETGSAPASRGRIGIGVAPTTLDKRQSSWSRLRLLDEVVAAGGHGAGQLGHGPGAGAARGAVLHRHPVDADRRVGGVVQLDEVVGEGGAGVAAAAVRLADDEAGAGGLGGRQAEAGGQGGEAERAGAEQREPAACAPGGGGHG